MPLYEYECGACGHRFESIQKFSDAPLESCPKCGGAVHKLQSAPAFQFKGTGWYVTDYAKKDPAAAVKTDSGPSESKETGTEGSKSDKPDTSEKADKGDKADNTEKKSEKTEKGEKSQKTDKTSATTKSDG
jgi:putative FmdB family regulatory protein